MGADQMFVIALVVAFVGVIVWINRVSRKQNTAQRPDGVSSEHTASSREARH